MIVFCPLINAPPTSSSSYGNPLGRGGSVAYLEKKKKIWYQQSRVIKAAKILSHVVF